MFCVLLIVVYLSLSVLFLIRTEWFKKCCGNLWNQWKHQHFFVKTFIVVFIAYMTVFATVKQPSEPTAPPAGTENTPFVQEVILSKISDSEDVSENLKDPLMIDPMSMDRNFYDSTTNIITRVVTNTALTWLYPPTNALTYDRWTQYGVAEDTFWVPATNWAFVYGSNLVEGAHVSSSGTLSFNLPKSSSNPHGMPDGTGINFLAPFHSSLAVIPTNGCFWAG